MRRYEQDWATHKIAWTVAKNKRGYQKKTGRFTFHHSQGDEDDTVTEGHQQDPDEQGEVENEAEGIRKRTKAKQGGTKGKRVKV